MKKRGLRKMEYPHRAVWEKYRAVRMFQVVTDIEDEADNRFYRSFGMRPLADGNMISYFR